MISDVLHEAPPTATNGVALVPILSG